MSVRIFAAHHVKHWAAVRSARGMSNSLSDVSVNMLNFCTVFHTLGTMQFAVCEPTELITRR